MFERYTEKARRVIFLARDEALEFGSAEIGTGHLMLGLLREDRVNSGLFLPRAASVEAVRAELEARMARAAKVPSRLDIPLSNGSKRVLAYAAEEAQRLGHRHIGPEHLWLGLLREESCEAAGVMRMNGADLKALRKAIAEGQLRKETQEEAEATRAGTGRPIDPGNANQPTRDAAEKGLGFEQYSESARRAIFFARMEAEKMGSAKFEAEHLLLGLIWQGGEFLELFFGSVEAAGTVREELAANSTTSKETREAQAHLPISEECRRALGRGAAAAERLGKDQVGVEHLLLGLLEETGSFAAQLMVERGADAERIWNSLEGKTT